MNVTASRNFFVRNSAAGSSQKSSTNIYCAERANFYELVTCFSLTLFLDRKYYNGQWINEKVFRIHCLNTISCLHAPVFYPFPCYTIFTFRLRWDFVPFLLTKYLVCFAEMNLHCFSSKNHLNGDWEEDSCKRSSGTPLA